MAFSWFRGVAVATLVAVPSAALAAPPVVQPVQIGAETVRFTQGVPTVELQLQNGAVQIRPLPMERGSIAFSVAVFNGGTGSANIDIANFDVATGDRRLAVFSVDDLIRKAKNRAMWSQIGLALAGGIAAAGAASQRDTYTSTFYTPRATYHSVYSAPSAWGQVQAAAITAGTAYGVVAIQNQLDRTREALGNEVVQLSTVDPGQSYAGKIVVEKIRGARLPQRVTVTVDWNGERYPFAFQLAKAGTPQPVFTALTPPEPMAEAGKKEAPVAAVPTITPVATAAVPAAALAPALAVPVAPAAVPVSTGNGGLVPVIPPVPAQSAGSGGAAAQAAPILEAVPAKPAA